MASDQRHRVEEQVRESGSGVQFFSAGLSEQEAQARIKAEGYNEIPRSERRALPRIIVDVVQEPMLALLLAGGVIYFVLGDQVEALVLLAFALMSVLITVVQESRTEHVLEALRDLTSPRALVVRDGKPKRVAGREVARGDIILLAEGDRVPADGVIVQCQDLQIDESLLTGESVPVRKVAIADNAEPPTWRPGGDDLPFVFSGSLVVRGAGVGKVTAIGSKSEIGKVGQSLSVVETEPPPLQIQTRRLVRLFAVLGGGLSIFAALLYGLTRGGWLDALLAGIALGMAMLPEEMPVVLTVFMVMGAWRISRSRVLTRRAAAIETLGSATVLCTDKTGTLTENRMTIVDLRAWDGTVFHSMDASSSVIPESFQTLIAFGLLASAREAMDPMEQAFHAFAKAHLAAAEVRRLEKWTLRHVYGVSPNLLAMTQIWETGDGNQEFVVAAKGAPEAIGSLCGFDSATMDAMKSNVDIMAAKGLRVLGVARASYDGEQRPPTPHGFAFEFLGLVGLADPLRAGVRSAVTEARSAGIRVIMITGDYPATATAIAAEAGLDGRGVLKGSDIEHLDEADLARLVKTTSVFARIMPEQKLRIVNALKANGDVVAMTGDGVNDAPSIKSAHIGIAMGGRGTDVAREASSLVLLDDDFGSIVNAIRLGRRIYDNILKAMSFIGAVHVPIAGLTILPLILGMPILFGPMHIAFLQMVIDPVCALVFEAETEEEDIMRRPPRAPSEPLFSWAMIGWSGFQGISVFFLGATIYFVSLWNDMPESEIRATTFFSLLIMIVGLIFINRSFSASVMTAVWRPNRMLAVVLVIVSVISVLTLLWPPARELFRFGLMGVGSSILVFGACITLLLAIEFVKRLWVVRRQI